jgi:hypothetical protein
VTFSVSQVAGGVGTFGSVPAFGEYTNVPATFAVASSWVALNFVPTVIGAGVGHVISLVSGVAVVDALAEAVV